MKPLINILLCFLFSSCLTVKRIEKNCDLFARVCGTGSSTEIRYRDTVIYLDRVIPVLLPKDTAKAKGDLIIDDQGAQMDQITSKKGIVTLTAEVKNSKLSAEAFINRDSITAHIRDSVFLHNAIRESNNKSTIVIKEKHVPGIYKFSFWLFILEIMALFLYIIKQICQVRFF